MTAEAPSGSPVGHRPTRAEIDFARFVLAPWRWITAPRFSGLEHIPTDRPVMLAGNHTTWAVLDSPLLLFGLYERLGILPRTLGDHAHFRVPAWRKLLERFGVVDGTPENVRALMRARESIAVFPGGAREVFKRRRERYCLLWGKRTGFARLAIEFGYPIVPFSLVGAEDVYDIVLDADDLLASSLGPIIARLTQEFDTLRGGIVAKLMARLNGQLSPADKAYIEGAFRLLQNQFLHGPISALAEENPDASRHTLLEALRKMFRLEE